MEEEAEESRTAHLLQSAVTAAPIEIIPFIVTSNVIIHVTSIHHA